jgi:hypothetical protein
VAITDERTLAGWLIGPTVLRARDLEEQGVDPVIRFADVEEHVVDPASRLTKRCDLTLRGESGAVAAAEMKRPEVMQASDPHLITDAWTKAVARGLPYFLTCNFAQVMIWDTSKGELQHEPVESVDLAPGLTHSIYAPQRRGEISDNWIICLDLLAGLLRTRLERLHRARRALPPRAEELKNAIVAIADEAATRIQSAASNPAYREKVLDLFRRQFGVEMTLDPLGGAERLYREARQVATICGFVLATRLILYQALSDNATQLGRSVRLDKLDLNRDSNDPVRVMRELHALYEHARRKTGDFELQLAASEVDEILFVDVDPAGEVGGLWEALSTPSKNSTGADRLTTFQASMKLF